MPQNITDRVQSLIQTLEALLSGGEDRWLTWNLPRVIMEGKMIRLISQKSLPILLVFLIFMVLTLHPAFALSPLNVTVRTDKTSYQLRKNVNISGNVTYNGAPVSSGLAGIQVKGPQGTFIARTRPLGPTVSQNFVMEIVLVTLSADQYGNPQKTIIRGNTAYFTVIVRNKGFTDRTVTITLNIYDNDTIPIGYKALTIQILAGATINYTWSLDIQSWAKNGTATVYANVWDSLPESNGVPYCPEKAATFAILESQYDETLPKQVSPQPIQNGTFNIGFRLSPEPKPGTYTVYATATYQGWKPDRPASTTFQVVDVIVPPRASFVMKPPRVAPNYIMSFDASSSTPEGYNQTITNYSWNFGDGQTGIGQTVSHYYPTVGNRMVTLNVTSSRGLWNTTTRTAIIIIIHNVAVVSISCFNDVYNDWKAPVSVSLKNKGTVSETLNVTLYAGSVFGGKTTISNLAPYATTSATITWDTKGLLPGHNYTIAAVSDTLPNETNTTDNRQQYGPIFVGLLGDIDFDRKIGILDVVRVTAIYGAKSGGSNWDIMCDLDPDGVIGILDVVAVTSRYGQKY